ncbi:hypothetical protein ACS0TY_027240 [Phlomoides rotata]
MEDKWRKMKWRGSMSFLFLPFEPISINTAIIKLCYTAAASPSLRRRRVPLTLSRPLVRSFSAQVNHLTGQVLAAIIQNKPSIPLHLFQSPRSIRHQNTFRHISPLRQRILRQETVKYQKGSLILGPVAHRDPKLLNLGLEKVLDFYYWVETHFGFQHNEQTCKQMALVLVRGNRMNLFWDFLKNMSGRNINCNLVTTTSMTCLIKALGEENLVNRAVSASYRMKQFHCKPDACAYNAVIYALFRVGFFQES